MNQSRRTAMLWFLAGAAMIAAGLMSEPVRLFTITAGVLLALVGVKTLRSCRRSSAGREA